MTTLFSYLNQWFNLIEFSPLLRMGIRINRSIYVHLTNSMETEPLKNINSNLENLQLMNCVLNCVLKYIQLNIYANDYGSYI